MPDLDASLARLRGRWFNGGAAITLCPPDWLETVRSGAGDTELTLLALAGQASRVAFRPAPGQELISSTPIPRLSRPCLPHAERQLFQRALVGGWLVELRDILMLVARRGYSVHPADWMPIRNRVGELELYAPWDHWLDSGAASGRQRDALTVETWDQWPAAERRAELRALRRSDPAGARALITAKAASEHADERDALLCVLGVGLSDADVPYLQSLSTDRSSQVRSRAEELLAKAGWYGSAKEVRNRVRDLVGYLDVDGKRPWSGGRVKSRRIWTYDEVLRRQQLYRSVPFDALADVLELSPEALAAAWDPDDYMFYVRLVETGSDAACKAAADALMRCETAPDKFCGFGSRLTQGERLRLVEWTVNLDQSNVLTCALNCARDELGSVPLSPLASCPAFSKLRTAIAETDHPLSQRIEIDLPASKFGLLARQDAAVALIDILVAAGLPAAHPALAILQLNAALPPASTET